jgi:dUTP pyrophosphatase
MKQPIQILRLNKELPLPRYARDGDAGFDLLASAALTLEPGERRLVPTGVALAIPDGYVGLVHPRSGLAAKHGITVLNAPGTIDSGFRGEIQVILWNTSDKPFNIEQADRIAQLVVQEFVTADLLEVLYLDDTERGQAGFGSTGVAAHR